MKHIKLFLFFFIGIALCSCASLVDFANAISEVSGASSSSSSSSSSGSASSYTSSYSNTNSSSSSSPSYSTTSSSISQRKTRVRVECWACKGTGKTVARIYPATYGQTENEMKREYCKYCGQKDRPHTHKSCTACKGLGYTYEYK